MQFSVAHFSEGSDRDLAASAQSVEQRPLAGGGGTSRSVVQEFQMLACGGIAFADFDPERSLPRSRAHDFGRDDLGDQLRLTQTLQPRCGQYDGVIFPLLKFAQPRIDITAQGMNVQISPNGLQLSLAPQAGRSTRAPWGRSSTFA